MIELLLYLFRNDDRLDDYFRFCKKNETIVLCKFFLTIFNDTERGISRYRGHLDINSLNDMLNRLYNFKNPVKIPGYNNPFHFGYEKSLHNSLLFNYKYSHKLQNIQKCKTSGVVKDIYFYLYKIETDSISIPLFINGVQHSLGDITKVVEQLTWFVVYDGMVERERTKKWFVEVFKKVIDDEISQKYKS